MTKEKASAPQAERRAERKRVTWFAYADRALCRVLDLIRAIHEGFWLGCLTADDLNAITSKHFGDSRYFASSDYNLGGLFNWEKSVVDQYFPSGARILVAGAGAGREVLALRKAGFDAEGFECNPGLVAAGRDICAQLGETSRVVPSETDGVPSGPAVYGGLIAGWGAYTHIPTRRRRVLFLQALKQRALVHSPLLVSFLTRDASARFENLSYCTAKLSRFLLRGRKGAVELGDHIEWGRYVHRFSGEELAAELNSAGFRVVHYSDGADYTHAVGVAE